MSEKSEGSVQRSPLILFNPDYNQDDRYDFSRGEPFGRLILTAVYP
jgi:hypothetical protein